MSSRIDSLLTTTILAPLAASTHVLPVVLLLTLLAASSMAPMLAGPAVAQEPGEEELVDRIVAVVDKTPIFLSDVDNAMAEVLYMRRLRGEPMPADSAEAAALRVGLLQSIIERKIVVAKARKLEIEVTRTDVEDALDQWLSDLIRSSGSETAFEMELERQGMTVKDLKAQYRKDIEEQLLVSRFMQREFRNVTITDEEIRHFYDAKYDSIPDMPEVIGLAHIIIFPKIAPDRESEARERVDEIMARLERGDPFGEVAGDLSDDAMTRASGGRIGTVAIYDLQEDLADIASGLEPEQVSDAVRTRYGYEIVRLDQKNGDLYTLSHILVELKPAAGDTIEAARLAYEVRDRAAGGESFEELAREYSDDIETRDDGGYVGEVDITSLDEVYREGLAGLQPGEISDVLTTQRGFQILKLASRTAGRKPTLDEARQWISGVLESRKREALFTEWLEDAGQEVYVERMEF